MTATSYTTTVRLRNKGQFSIDPDICADLGISPGDPTIFEFEGLRTVLKTTEVDSRYFMAVIPKRARDFIGLEKGQLVEITVYNPKVVEESGAETEGDKQ